MLDCVLRDAEFHPLTREVFELRAGEGIADIHGALAEVVSEGREARALLELALDFRAWQRLHACGLMNAEAAQAMTGAILCR